MLRVLEAQAPPKQTATETISILSSRLASATLLEDRRAAILGLRSFAKEYPASVASGALRSLIACLTKDTEDVDTLKVVLETLLGLFHPDDDSLEASEEIALWLADQFSQQQDNTTILINLLDPEKPDFYSRLYSLQLIQAVAHARPERTQECILAAPMGTSWLVATLDDARDAVRNEGLVVLNDLARSSNELQKLFVFEDAFTKVFNMIHSNGGLMQGSVVVQDCLSLLANLIRHNTSNQTNIREMGHVAKFAALLPHGKESNKQWTLTQEDDQWVSPQSDKNIWGLLAIMRMFLVKGSAGTPQNQVVFHQHGLIRQLLDIAFDPVTAIPIKTEAILTIADAIKGNARIQESFGQEQVRPMVESTTHGAAITNNTPQVHVIEALLDLLLNPASSEQFDIRTASCECIQAYFYNHLQIQQFFLRRAIDGFKNIDTTANALTILVDGPRDSPASDPYRIWFAATLMFHLIFNDKQAKATLMQVKQGDAENGEEVVTCIQIITANLIASLQLGDDERVLIAYLSLLMGWLFEDATAVNDFLGEASSLQSLIQAILTPGDGRIVIRGLGAALLGVVYEFSTKDSPVPRRELQSLFNSKLGREKYLDAISGLRNHSLVRDFEVLPRLGGGGGGLPEIFFNETFIDFLKDNFSRLLRAIDRDPGIEQHQTQDGVDRDLMDALRGERDEEQRKVLELKAQLMTLEQRLDQEKAEHRKTQQSTDEQCNTLRRINDKLYHDFDKESKNRENEHRGAILEIEDKHKVQISAANAKTQQADRDANLALSKLRQECQQRLQEAEKIRKELENRLTKSDQTREETLEKIQFLEQTQQQTRSELSIAVEARQAQEARTQENMIHIRSLVDEQQTLKSSIINLKADNQDLKTKAQDLTWKIKDAEEKAHQAESNVKKAVENEFRELHEKLQKAEANERHKQTELDDLFVLLGDLEEKRNSDKKRLKALGEEVSDADEDEDEIEEDDSKDEEAE